MHLGRGNVSSHAEKESAANSQLGGVKDAVWEMSAAKEDSRCQKAVRIVTDLCRKKSLPSLDLDTCRGFLLLPSDQSLSISEPELSISLLAVIVIVCGLALVAVFLFLFWKLCWVPWRNKAISSNVSQSEAACNQETMAGKLKDTGTLGFLEAAVKISHTSPDIPAEVQMSMKDHITRHVRLQRQTTEPASSTRHISFKRHLPRQMHVSSMDYGTTPPLGP
ncbi:synaptotagmin-6 [Gopherus evgoodei]|uniref:synaptotagmin-6 n=1 Tax=Gopherus evgoodei TaxID=1825980 RepID=UPI0011D02D62|nr:synaptotagmin-6 [Gopherus evgoodei]